MKNETITRVSASEIDTLIANDGDRTDWTRASAMTQDELDAAILDDPDEGPAHLAIDWSKAAIGLPERKAMVNMRLDRDVLDWFRREGHGYQTRINAVLRSYVEAMRKVG